MIEFGNELIVINVDLWICFMNIYSFGKYFWIIDNMEFIVYIGFVNIFYDVNFIFGFILELIRINLVIFDIY